MWIDKLKDRVAEITKTICGLFMCGLVLTVTIQILARQLFKIPTPWTEELAKYFVIWGTFVGAVQLYIRSEHLLVDVLYVHFSEIGRAVMRVVNAIVAAIYSGYLTVFGVQLCTNPRIINTMTPAMEISRVWMYIFMPVFMVVLFAIATIDIFLYTKRLIQMLKERKNGGELEC